MEPLEDRSLLSTLSIVNGTLTYAETSGINHNLSVAYLAGAPGRYFITDSENFTQVTAGWTGVGTNRASGPDTGITAGQIATGAGNDRINIQGIRQPFNVNTGAGNDTFNVNVAGQPQTVLNSGPLPSVVVAGDFNNDGILDLAETGNNSGGILDLYLGNGDGSFAFPLTTAVGPTPFAVAAGDFNGDGKLDLAVTNDSYNPPKGTLGIFLGNGDGTFQPTVTYATGRDPRNVAAADFNHDGILDLAVVENANHQVGVLLGNGNGTFQPQASTAIESEVSFDLVVGDFNGDGRQDVAMANYFSRNLPDTMSVYLGNGTGTFAPAPTFASDQHLSTIKTGDFNGDGKLDVVVTTWPLGSGDGYVDVLVGNGNGTFAPLPTLAAGGQGGPLTVGDWNVDGKLDLIFGGELRLGNGNGTFQSPVAIPGLRYTDLGPVDDLNKDGIPDLVTSNFIDSTVNVFTDPGSGGNGLGQNALTLDGGSGTNQLNVLDDGGSFTDEIFVGGNQITSPNIPFTIDYQATGGDFQGGISVSAPRLLPDPGVGQFPTGIAVGDFNGDLKPDVAAANYGPTYGNSVSVLLSNGYAGLGPQLTVALPPGTNPFAVATGVFNRSGNEDIVTGNFAGQSIAYIAGNGDGTFQAPVLLPAADSSGGLHKIIGLAVDDLNGDGNQDIVATSGDGTYTIYLGNGNGTFQELPSQSALTPIIGVSIADVTGDGKPDLVAAAFAAWKVEVLPGNGDGTFGTPTFTDVGGQTDEFLTTGDFNGDGKTDVATSNKDSNTVSVLLGDGNGTFGTPTTYAVGATPMGITVGTFNLNGQLDLAVANVVFDLPSRPGAGTAQGFVTLLRGHGDGTFATSGQQFPAANGIAVAAGDFDPGEAMQDVVSTSFIGLHDFVSITSTNVKFAAPTITSFSPSSGPVGSQVIIAGTNFTDVSAVAFDGVATDNYTVNAAGTQIMVVVPSGAMSGPIGAAGRGGVAVSSASFTVSARPGVFQPPAGLAPLQVAATQETWSPTATNEEPKPGEADLFFAGQSPFDPLHGTAGA